MTVSPESAANIDALSFEELERQVNLGRHSIFSNENLAYVRARLERETREQQQEQIDNSLRLVEKANQFAKDANSIAGSNRNIALWVLWISVGSLLVAVAAIITAHFWK